MFDESVLLGWAATRIVQSLLRVLGSAAKRYLLSGLIILILGGLILNILNLLVVIFSVGLHSAGSLLRADFLLTAFDVERLKLLHSHACAWVRLIDLNAGAGDPNITLPNHLFAINLIFLLTDVG